MTVARQLADFLAGISVADLPPQAIDNAAMIIASTLASAAAGTQLASARIIRDLARERGGRPDAALWFDADARAPIADAAQANAVMSDAAASDDSDLRNIVHTGTPLCAAALAVAEKTGASGQDVLAAIVLRLEAAGRINTAMHGGLQTKGFHGCIVAIFAATAAAGRLMKLERAQMAQAIALSATSMGGLATAAIPSVAREYHAGLATMLGVNAAQAAGMGFIARKIILETKHGFFEVRWQQARRVAAIATHGSAKAGTSAPTWGSSSCRAVIRTTRSPRPRPTPPARRTSRRRRSSRSPSHVPA